MKSLLPVFAALAAAPFAFAAEDVKPTVPAVESAPAAASAEITPEQRALFLQGLGWLVGQQSGLVQDLRVSAEDVPAITEGFRLALLGEGKDFPEKIIAMNDAYSAFIQDLQAAAAEKIEAEMQAAAAENKKLGAEFVRKTLEGDKAFSALPSGVLMKIVKPGDAAKKPSTDDVVAVRYTGKLIDGSIFDSSARDENGVPVPFTAGAGEPVQFPLGGLIAAWGEALPRLGVGGVCTIVVPAEQGYGDRAAGMIPPGATLIFDIELADIPAPEAPSAAPAAEE